MMKYNQHGSFFADTKVAVCWKRIQIGLGINTFHVSSPSSLPSLFFVLPRSESQESCSSAAHQYEGVELLETKNGKLAGLGIKRTYVICMYISIAFNICNIYISVMYIICVYICLYIYANISR